MSFLPSILPAIRSSHQADNSLLCFNDWDGFHPMYPFQTGHCMVRCLLLTKRQSFTAFEQSKNIMTFISYDFAACIQGISKKQNRSIRLAGP